MPGHLRELVETLEVASRVGHRRVGDPALLGRLSALPGYWSWKSTPRTGTWSPYCWWKAWSAGISSRHGGQPANQRLSTIGPLSEERSTLRAPAEALAA